MLIEYNGMASILYLSCPRDFMRQGRHFCHVVVFSFHVVMSVLSQSYVPVTSTLFTVMWY